jgi:hypothetical protein
MTKESEEIRKRMQRYSEQINCGLDSQSHCSLAGLRYEHDPDQCCPRCGSGLKRKFGIVKGRQKFQCISCWRIYFEREDK